MPALAHLVRRCPRLRVAVCTLAVMWGLAGCGAFTPAQKTVSSSPAGDKSTASPSRSTAEPSPSPSPTPTLCPVKLAPGFPCPMREHARLARDYMQSLPGNLGLVLHDRVTGHTWTWGSYATLYPAASTIKLAMMTDILQRQAAGRFTLTTADHDAMFGALFTSNDVDADKLWFRYEDGSFLDRIRAFGMGSTHFTSQVYWGDVDSTAQDLDNLMNYVLDQAAPSIRNYLIFRLRHVSGIDQKWGVWGAGPKNQPGNKDGWEQDPNGYGVWITNTVGFAGPHERYTLAIMYDLGSYGERGDTGFDFGTNALTQISALLFKGHRTVMAPAPQASAVP
jgi:hypothetical protein